MSGLKDVSPADIGMIKTKTGWKTPDQLSDIEQQREQMVRDIALRVEPVMAAMYSLKQYIHDEVLSHVQLCNEGVDIVPQLMNGTYESLDGSIAIEVDYAPIYRVNENMARLQSVLNAALEELDHDRNKSAVRIIRKVLRIDTHNIDVKQLKKLSDIDLSGESENWRLALDLADSCTYLAGYHPYFRVYSVDDQGVRFPLIRNFSAIKIDDGDENDQN